MHQRWFGWVIVGLLMVCAATPVGAESSWKMPNLNPFAKDSTKPTTTKKSSGFTMPNLIPSWGKPSKRPSSEPSTWTKFNTGTKQFFAKTKDVLTPWDDSPATKKEKKSFFTGWLTEKEEVQKPRSVSEFLAQPRPRP
jgi:hypothetical protein